VTLALIAIPVLPLLASVLVGAGGRWLGERSHLPALAAAVLSFALSVAAVFHVVSSGPVQIPLYSWIGAGAFDVQFGLLVDRLTVVMLVMVTAISGIVQVYSVRYMQGDGGYARFFAYVSLFTGSMLMLVMSDNLLMLFLFWEEVGLCSYLLIGFTYERRTACEAAVKAFWVNRIGDGGFLLAILLAFSTFGTLDTLTIVREAPMRAGETVALFGPYGSVNTLTLLTLLFLFSALAKSAQLPLHVWLPDAMEAPTPVSALIHAATMVTAGVFLVARFSPLFDLAETTRYVLVVVGGASAIFGAAVSMVQTDIKRVLAYSTMSQLGFMIMACGLGVYSLAVFHLVAHAAFKSLLFLTAGSAIEEVADRVESPEPAHPVSRLPARFWLLWISAVALAAMPPLVLLAGGKDLFRLLAPVGQGHVVFWVLAWATALMTVVYLLRLVVAAAPRSGREGEPLRLLTPQALGFVVATMAAVTFCAIWAPLVGWTWFERFLAPALPAPLHGAAATAVEGSLSTVVLVVVPLTIATVVWGVLYPVLRRRVKAAPGRWEQWGRTLYVVVLNRGYVDEIYQATLVRPMLRAARWLSASVEEGVIDRAVDGVGAALKGIGRQLRQAQSGQFHQYAVAVVVGAVLILGLYLVAGWRG
jgi:NADH-quinone oxidoreductase subunit L